MKMIKKTVLTAIATSIVCAFSSMGLSCYADSYADGTYTGSAMGCNDNITVEVTVSGGAITAIKITDDSDDEPFITNAEAVIDSIIASQSTDVDVVSGATYSSEGIIGAVKNALSGAVIEETEATTEEATTTTESTTTDSSEEDTSTTTTTTSSSDSSTTTTTDSSSSDDDSSSSTTVATEDTATQTGDNSLTGILATAVVCALATFGVSRIKKNIRK